MTVVCLDTNIVIWGVKKVATVGQEELVIRAANLLKQFEIDKTEAIIPAIVIAEILSAEGEAQNRLRLMTTIQNKFKILPFDSKAAWFYAQVWQAYKSRQSPPIASPRPREGLKADSFIIAIALANNASCIYSHDKHLKAMATGFIEVKEVPLTQHLFL